MHVPYRESLMTFILCDSIGGNCITRMVATMSPKHEDIMESISTCRFAQRVTLIKNSVEKMRLLILRDHRSVKKGDCSTQGGNCSFEKRIVEGLAR